MVDQELNPVRFFWRVGNCDLDTTTTVGLGRGFPTGLTVEVCFTGMCLCGSVYLRCLWLVTVQHSPCVLW